MKIIHLVSEDLILFDVPRYGEQLWAKTKIRKAVNCLDCRNDIETENAFSPVTNQSNRAERLCLIYLPALIAEFQQTRAAAI